MDVRRNCLFRWLAADTVLLDDAGSLCAAWERKKGIAYEYLICN